MCPKRRLSGATRLALTSAVAKSHNAAKENVFENPDTSFSIANAETTSCHEAKAPPPWQFARQVDGGPRKAVTRWRPCCRLINANSRAAVRGSPRPPACSRIGWAATGKTKFAAVSPDYSSSFTAEIAKNAESKSQVNFGHHGGLA